MSSTGRGKRREACDLYETPSWSTHALLDAGALPEPSADAHWLEPSAGSGAIVRAVLTRCRLNKLSPPRWTMCEARRGEFGPLSAACELAVAVGAATPDVDIRIVDFLEEGPPKEPFDVAIGNPPYRLAFDFVRKLVDERWAHRVAMLLRMGFLESGVRYNWLQDNVPDIYAMTSRPSFTGGSTDSAMYGWMVWHPGQTGPRGRIELLPPRRRASKQGGDE